MKNHISHLLMVFLLTSLSTACLTTRSQLREDESRKSAQVQMEQQKKVQESTQGEELDAQLRELNGRIDVLQNQLAQVNAGQLGSADVEAKKNEDLNSRLRLYEDALKKMEMQMAALEQEIQTLKANEPVAKPGSAKKGNSYQTAEEAFTKKEWKEAIVSYQKYRDENPKGKAYASATYKIGIAFHELKMKDEARAFLEEVIAKFPKSKEAKKAEFRLKNL